MKTPFTKRTTVWIVVTSVVSFATALVLAVFGPEIGPVRSAAPDSYSRSALGHHAFCEVLEELGIPVVRSRYDSGRRAGAHALLVLLEPALAHRDAAALRRMVRDSGRALVVLPKWEGAESYDQRGRIESARLLPSTRPAAVLEAVHTGATVERPEEPLSGWKGGAPTLGAPQLLRGIEPVVSCDQGILVGRVGGVFVLSDPDVLANHGLGRPGNAALAVALVERARGKRETVVVDETAHGHVVEPSIYRALFSWPIVAVMASALLAAFVLLWTALERFGAPQPAPPVFEPGKGFLIGNIAALLRFGGQSAHALRHYLDSAVQDVRRRLHAPAELDRAGLLEWLDRYGAARRVETRLSELKEATAHGVRGDEPLVDVAQRIHRWRKEMVHGPGRDS